MDILTTEAPACNAAGLPSAVRAGHDAGGTRAEFVAGPFTEEKLQAWLDGHPGRRRAFERRDADEQAEERQRLSRLWALRTSKLPAELLAAVRLADQLQAALESITATYAPKEARRVLEAFGLAIPHEHDVCQAWGGDTFAEVRRDGRKLCRHLGEYRGLVWSVIEHLVPLEERPASLQALTALAAKGGAA